MRTLEGVSGISFKYAAYVEDIWKAGWYLTRSCFVVRVQSDIDTSKIEVTPEGNPGIPGQQKTAVLLSGGSNAHTFFFKRDGLAPRYNISHKKLETA